MKFLTLAKSFSWIMNFLLLISIQFYPTTGRDEFTEDNDQLYHEGIDIERTSDWSEAQDISKQHRSIFSPNYDETNTKNWKLKTLFVIDWSQFVMKVIEERYFHSVISQLESSFCKRTREIPFQQSFISESRRIFPISIRKLFFAFQVSRWDEKDRK